MNKSIATIYRDMKKEFPFPAPSRVGNRVYWKKKEVDVYMNTILNKGKENELGNE